MEFVSLTRSPLPSKKLRVTLLEGEKEHHVDFGSRIPYMEDFTKHHSEDKWGIEKISPENKDVDSWGIDVYTGYTVMLYFEKGTWKLVDKKIKLE